MVKDAIALVTGGASGIGFSTTEELLKNEVNRVYIADINVANGENAVKTLQQQYGNNRVTFLKLDVTNLKEFKENFETIINECGRLDILINNAGVFYGDKILDINIGGVRNGLKLAMEFMKKGAKVINTASTAGLLGLGPCFDYTASKHAVIGLTQAFSTSYWFDKTQVSVMVICPGVTLTPILENFKNFATKEEHQDLINLAKEFSFTKQTAESVAKSMITILKIGENGSAWLAKNNKLFELEFPPYTNLIKSEVAFV